MKPRHRFLALTLAFVPALAYGQSAPLDRAEILGRLATDGSSPSAIAKLVRTRGINFSVTEEFLTQVKLAGGDGILVKRLAEADNSGNPHPITDTTPSLEHMAKCVELIRTGAVEAAEPECRTATAESPQSPWPLWATAEALELFVNIPDDGGDVEKEKDPRALILRACALDPALVVDVRSSDGDPLLEVFNLRGLPLSDTKSLVGGKLGAFGMPDDAFSRIDEGENAGPVPQPADVSLSSAEQALRQDADLAATHIQLALVYARARHLDDAVSEFKAAIQLEPGNPDLRRSLAALYYSHGQHELALAELRESVRLAPSAVISRVALAAALDLMGRTPEAAVELQTLLANRPRALDASNALVELYLEHDDRTSAIRELRRFLQASSATFADEDEFVKAQFPRIYELARLLHQNHELNASIEQYLLLLRTQPADAGLLNDYGIVLLEEHRVDEAMGQFDQAQRLDPDMPEAHHNYAICLVLKKNLDGALAEFHRALELNPDEPHSHEWLGAALSQQGNAAEALDEFQQAIQKDPKDPRVHASIGGILLELKDEAGALKELKLAIELKSEDPEVINNLAWLYATAEESRLRDPVEALRLARIAVEKSPSPNPAYLDTLAEALVLNGKPAEALALEEKALALDPHNPELQSRISRFRVAAGKPASPQS